MWQTLLGTIVGGFLTLGAWIVQDFVSTGRRRKALRAALSAEISSLVYLIRLQGYATELRQIARNRTVLSLGIDYVVPVKQGYFTIYEANASTIGELDAEIATDVVHFYQGAKSLVDSLSGVVSPEIFHVPGERAARYDLIADALDELCEIGTDVAHRLAPPSAKWLAKEDALKRKMSPKSAVV